MPLAERSDRVTLDGSNPQSRARGGGANSSALLSLVGKNTDTDGRILTVRHIKGGVPVIVAEIEIPGNACIPSSPPLPQLILAAADETADFALDGSGAWTLIGNWLDRSS